ncbi:hypothetical protein DFH27DRAFT_569179 [Peziza echinospora]|nr:hypothetical protein DFH27DRAFT_569179 [Peziza echinospora]
MSDLTVRAVAAVGVSRRVSARDLFERQVTCPSSAYPVVCSDTGGNTCCPSGYRCINNGFNCTPDLTSGLSKGAKIGIGVGVAVAFLIVIGVGLAIFFYCCRKATKLISSGATQHQAGHAYNANSTPYNPQPPVATPYNPNGGGYPPPPQQGYGQYPQGQGIPLQDTTGANNYNANYNAAGQQPQYTGYSQQGTYDQYAPGPQQPTQQQNAPYNQSTTPVPAAPPYAPPQPYNYQPQQSGWTAPRGYSAVQTDPNAVHHEVEGSGNKL